MFECIIKAIKQNGILKLIRIMLEYLGVFSCNVTNRPFQLNQNHRFISFYIGTYYNKVVTMKSIMKQTFQQNLHHKTIHETAKKNVKYQTTGLANKYCNLNRTY